MNAPLLPIDVTSPVTFAADIAKLNGTLFLPPRAPDAVAVLHPATGVPARYYRPFAQWLAGRGIAVLTYDYRDFGASATGAVSGSNATMAQWGLGDQPAAQRFAERMFQGVPLWVIGHSIGGVMAPFHPGAARIERLIAVAAGPVHTSDLSLKWKAFSGYFWWGPAALAARTMGYLPGRALGLGPDLPVGVYRQWRRWCTTPGFYLCDVGRTLPVPDWRAFRGELRAVAVADDGMVPPHVVWRLMQSYPEARHVQHTLRPIDVPIGHIAPFAERNRRLWPEIVGI